MNLPEMSFFLSPIAGAAGVVMAFMQTHRHGSSSSVSLLVGIPLGLVGGFVIYRGMARLARVVWKKTPVRHRGEWWHFLDLQCLRHLYRMVFVFGFRDWFFMLLPNKSPEPTAVGAVSSAVAVHVASRRWLSFFR